MKDTAKIIISALIGGISALVAYQIIKKIFCRKKPAEETPENPVQIESEPADEKEFEQQWSGGHVYPGTDMHRSVTPADIAMIYPSSIIDEKSRTDYSAYLKIADSYSEKDVAGDECNSTQQQDEIIYSITPDDFNEMGNYQAVSLTYFADGVIADSEDVKIYDVKELIGNFDPHLIGEYEPDVAYIRNDYLMTDFEIVRDLRTYQEVLEEKPYLAGRKEDHD